MHKRNKSYKNETMIQDDEKSSYVTRAMNQNIIKNINFLFLYKRKKENLYQIN